MSIATGQPVDNLPPSTPLPSSSQQSNYRKDQAAMNVPSSTTSPPHAQDNNNIQRTHSRRSNSLHRKASNVSARNTSNDQNTSSSTNSSHHNNNNSNISTPGDKNRTKSQEMQRRSSESKKQAVRIQNYVIYRKTIGQGSMGKVKLAECLTDRDQQKYAVKIMPKVDLASIPVSNEKPKDPKDTPKEREQRTVRELAIMYLLRHPNICQLKDWVTEGDYYYMFLEYVDGGQLLDYIIQHGKLHEKQARKFARQIASALDYCHRNSIVHRDLKIENILITRDENIKIIDFGLSNIYSPSKLLSTFCGSLYFAAPELLKARHYTGPEVDVWSFGVVLYVLVCGRVPFDDTSLPALHAKIKSGVIDEYPDHLSKECVDLLSKILVVDPRKRLTLAAVENHPWMKKGYEEPIYSNIPQRQALEKVDMDIVKGMHGFGLGDEQLIRSKLERLIKTPEYKQAVIKIEQNQQLEWQRQNQAPIPRWRRSITPTNKKSNQTDDDPLSLPAMYDPLLSIYYLVKERKEYDTRRQLDMVQSKPLYHSAGGLSRSTSTVAPRPKAVSAITGNASTTLVRRKTDGSRNSARARNTSNQSPSTGAMNVDIADTTSTSSSSPPQRKPSIGSRLGRTSSVRLITKSVTERTNSIRERSKSAVKILGSMLPNRPLMFSDVKPKTTTTNVAVTNSSDVGPASPPPPEMPSPSSSSRSTPPKKSYQKWLHSDPHGGDTSNNYNTDESNSKLSSSPSSSFTTSTTTATATTPSKHYQQTRKSWRQLSRIKHGNTRSGMDESNLTESVSTNELANSSSSPPPTNRFSESDKGKTKTE
ncbi:kinase-like domain-containing protein [Absidia repens]|uniref:Kinase-like domain-containing protein n=1 Tax=Absidia repens TaxID=90262 RepID=A0A1X2J0H0_9FUNG|nr:kinase-like domain-containing protein [Absidia repens]